MQDKTAKQLTDVLEMIGLLSENVRGKGSSGLSNCISTPSTHWKLNTSDEHHKYGRRKLTMGTTSMVNSSETWKPKRRKLEIRNVTTW